MMHPRVQIGLVATLLIAFGIGLTLYKATRLGLPLLPGESREVWTIESKISFKPSSGPVDIELKLPQSLGGWVTLEEHFASSGFGFSVEDVGSGRSAARWTRQSLDHPTTLYYKIQAYRANEDALPEYPTRVDSPPRLKADQLAAMERLVEVLKERSTGPESLVKLMIQQLNRDDPDPDAEFLMGSYSGTRDSLMLDVMSFAEIPAHLVRGVQLQDGRRRQQLSSLLEIYDGDRWLVFNPDTGSMGLPDDFYVWQRGPGAVLRVVGARDSRLEFALVNNRLPAKTVVSMEQQSENFALLDFSIYALPVEQQGIFKGLLLIPVAAFVVVVLRLLVGIKTSGTFMPVLIALAFLQTTLWVGLAIFLVIVSVGLWIRSWLSHLNLLLVARVSAVVIVVILLMAAMAVLSYRLGLDQALTVTFFPIIILAWTVERMSILWEEEGGREVLMQGGGSLIVAVLAYLVMSIGVVAHLTFNFPELLLSLLGLVLLLGKYTGYRLSELYRFRELVNQK
ncbi:inactive transglutaminase family protein [Parahaliea sp. F7430]|uniref:Inactive transglutaminase family protein n=1 Tax=Sediminihaliea albiluteola TaxID=2758564 RepID=A0A7W2YIA6_9GAMM|nr:inactive transglutaminase family protein [Sediminihaliea albiluteola]MBA6411860.1 inactive transglutaminase family protein [Sediminihaliea albiluteola]